MLKSGYFDSGDRQGGIWNAGRSPRSLTNGTRSGRATAGRPIKGNWIMRVLTAGCLAGLLCVVSVPTRSAAVEFDDAVDVSSFVTADEAQSAGEALEGASRWGEAVQFYKAALKRWEADSKLSYALRRTRVHFAIESRYTDNSFERQLLRQDRDQLLDILEEVLVRIDLEYVKYVTAKRFIAHGTESFYMALSNPRFIERHLSGVEDAAVDRVKRTLLNSFWNRKIGSRLEARMVVSEACDLVSQELRAASEEAQLALRSAVVLEYIFGGCNVLDEYSHVLTPDRYKDLNGSIEGEFVGVGIEIIADSGRGIQLMRVLPGSPAEKGGLRPGDRIVRINGTDCREMTTDEAAQLLRGIAGSYLTLGFEDPDGEYNEGRFRRESVEIHSITHVLMLDEDRGIGYIRQNVFQSTTPQELDRALEKLERRGMKSLIWDLRDNPGGLLETAASVIDRFIDRGVLVTTRGRFVDQNQEFKAHPWDTRKYPLVLLVDEDSASASEIVAGAIDDHERGKIVGRRTYGKWSVQTIIHLPGGNGLKLTTAKFYSPNNNNYSGHGLEPHVVVNGYRTTAFRAMTSDEVLLDPDVERAIEVLRSQSARRLREF